MPVTARKPYPVQPRDSVEHYHGDQIVYVCWEHHLLFAAAFVLCLPPTTSFKALTTEHIPPIIAQDPDAAKIDWLKVQWVKDGKAFKPDFAKSLADNGIDHKTLLRFETPGLNSVCGAATAA
ncbi:MAG: phenol hydroxylase subunit P4 [Sinobacteraceae bacterium]|nr:phenol hydroxylase subunit P4 [Nevskiaceae bacterium]